MGNSGSIVVQADWDASATTALSAPGTNFLVHPSVVTVRTIISAADISTITQDFPASAGGGTIADIPAGANRTLTLQGLDGINNPIFETTVPGLTIIASQTTDVGTVTLTLIGSPSIGVTVTPTSGLVTTEAGGTDIFTIVLNTPPTADVTVPVSSSDTTEMLVDTGGGPIASDSLVFTAVNWSIPQTVTLVGQNDAIDDGNQAITVTIPVTTSADANYNSLNPLDVNVSNSDNDFAGITVNPTGGLVTTEAGATAIFTVVLDLAPVPATAVTMPVTSGDTTEALVQGGDSPATPVTTINVTFTDANWFTPQTVTVVGQDDLIIDGTQTVGIVIGAATSGDPNFDSIDPPDLSIDSLDNEAAGVLVTPQFLSVSEGGASGAFAMRLSNAPTDDVTLSVTTGDTSEGLVQGGTSPDLPVASVDLTFTSFNWATAQNVTVVGQDDALVDPNVSFDVVTGAATSVDGNYNGFDPADVSVTNIDDDDPAILLVHDGNLVVNENAGTDTVDLVMTIAPTDDAIFVVEIDQSLIPSPALLTGGDSPSTPVQQITVTFTSEDWMTPQTVTVHGRDDGAATPFSYIFLETGTVTSADPNYNGFNPENLLGIMQDDDSFAIVLAQETEILEPAIVSEDGATHEFTMVLTSAPTDDVTVDISSGTPVEALILGGDSPVTPAATITVTFTTADWATPQTIRVVGQDDVAMDGNQFVTITTAAAVSIDGNYSGINPPNVFVTNVDDDSPGYTITPTILLTDESGGTDGFGVRLNSAPDGDVVLDLSSNNPADGIIDKAALTFTTANWNMEQTVTATGVDDAVCNSMAIFTVVIDINGATTDTTGYAVLNPPDILGLNLDDGLDCP